MAQVCEICGNGPHCENNVPHAHSVPRRPWGLNPRPVKVKFGPSANKRTRVCTGCTNSDKIVKA